MLITNQIINVKWNGYSRKWYEERGYKWTKQGETFKCKAEDLHPGTPTKVLVECDYKAEGCKGIHEKPYRQFTEDKERGYRNCCNNKKCGAIKTKEICLDKYGVDNVQKVKEIRNKVSEKQRKPFQLFIEQAKEKDLILFTTENEYENKKSRIRFICNKHSEYGEQETNAESFLINEGCCIYGKGEICAENSRLDGEIVYQAFVDKGLIPKFNPKDYKKNNQQLPFICPDHLDKGIQLKQYANLIVSSHKCCYCANEYTAKSLMLDQEFVFNYFEERGLLVEANEIYQGKDVKILCRCEKHLDYIQEIGYHALTATKNPCEYCRNEESISLLNRRLRSSIGLWKKQVEEECHYKCILTGSVVYDVHHLYPYNSIIKDVLNELNIQIKETYSGEEIKSIKNLVIEHHKKVDGICIENKLHILFHQIYSKDNTPEYFWEFVDNYKNGKYEEILNNSSFLVG